MEKISDLNLEIVTVGGNSYLGRVFGTDINLIASFHPTENLPYVDTEGIGEELRIETITVQGLFGNWLEPKIEHNKIKAQWK